MLWRMRGAGPRSCIDSSTPAARGVAGTPNWSAASPPCANGARVNGKVTSYNPDEGAEGARLRVGWHACFALRLSFGLGDTTGTISRSLLACLAVCALTTAAAQPAAPSARGELLYSTYCIACHSREGHWRQKKLATDWASLNAQVRRRAGNSGLGWSDDEIADVARYLNVVHYRFAAPSVTGSGGDALAGNIAQAD